MCTQVFAAASHQFSVPSCSVFDTDYLEPCRFVHRRSEVERKAVENDSSREYVSDDRAFSVEMHG